MPVISVRSSLKPDACTVGGWLGGCVGWGSAAAELTRRCRVHATHTRMHTQGTCGAGAARRAARRAAQGAYLESVHDVLLRVEVGARGLRRAGEQLAKFLEAAVVPAAGAQAALEGRSRLAPCWRGGRLPRLPRATATDWAAAFSPTPRTYDRLRCQVSGAKEMISLLSATEPRCFTISAIFSGG